jgi:hypothetical protein
MSTGSQILDDLMKEEHNLDREISDRAIILQRLRERIETLSLELDYIKKWIWTSDDENIIELREGLLAAAKMLIDQDDLNAYVEERMGCQIRSSIYDSDDIPF